MIKKIYRSDKTCLNCKHVVGNKFYPNCGQENTDTRKTFHHLFLHFFEDLTHYENAFWRTIKNLLFRPASLTKEYLSGKRLSYLAPVRLYIFVSFVTFFLMAILPSKQEKSIKTDKNKVTFTTGSHISLTFADNGDTLSDVNLVNTVFDKTKDSIATAEIKERQDQLSKLKIKEQKIEELKKSGVINAAEADSIKRLLQEFKKNKPQGFLNIQYKTVAALDSVENARPAKDKMNFLLYWIKKKTILARQNNTEDELVSKFGASAFHNFPKVLLLYMPLFAFFLWLFHDKKRWFYFDHGIFTLHYFSFLLLVTLLIFLMSKIFGLFGISNITAIISGLIKFISFSYVFYYFFSAHHRFYGQTRWVSFFKSMILFLINIILVFTIMMIFITYTIVNID